MPHPSRNGLLFAAFGSLALHALVFVVAGKPPDWFPRQPDEAKIEQNRVVLKLAPRPPQETRPKPAAHRIPAPARGPSAVIAPPRRATQAAPDAPSAAEWSFAAQYALKNGKAYRYLWGKQVRSMMGTAVEGDNAGTVRFRLEIAPDGTLAKLETLWTTSAAAERIARAAIENMARLPPTPTGQPLVFERTIAFTPFGSDWPPIYDDDCLPDPPASANRYAWDGNGPQAAPVAAKPAEKPDPQALEECRKQLPQNSIEAEVARDRRLQSRWGAAGLGQ